MALSVTRMEGSLVGLMTGDSLGGRVDGFTLGPLRHRYPDEASLLALTPASYGSATEMTAAMAVSLATFPDFNPENLAHELVRAATPERRYGLGTGTALERLREGVHWRAAASGPGGRTSFGNGAAVRSAPIALLYARDIDTLRWIAEEAAVITHSHALGGEGAVMQAVAVGMAALGARDPVDGAEFLLTIGAETQMREYRSRYESAARMLARDLDPVRVVDVLGNGRSALGSVVTAAYCFARHPDDFERAIATALALGGNASAIAAMTGAISGARLGIGAIPARWLDHIESDGLSVAKMRELAGGLAMAANRLR